MYPRDGIEIAHRTACVTERRKIMKESVPNSKAILETGEKSGVGIQNSVKPEAASWLRRLLQEVNASFDASFKPDREEAGLRWYWNVGPL